MVLAKVYLRGLKPADTGTALQMISLHKMSVLRREHDNEKDEEYYLCQTRNKDHKGEYEIIRKEGLGVMMRAVGGDNE